MSNEECSICLDLCKQDMYLLKCNHQFHLECIKGLCSTLCPLCRSEMNLPEEVRLVVENNERIRQEEIEKENIQTFFENFPEAEQTLGMIQLSFSIDIDKEARLAKVILERSGIPPEYIPEFTFDFGQFPVSRGSVFSAIVMSTLNIFLEALGDVSLSSSEESA